MNFQVKHILVKYEYEAQDILKKINEGLKFEEAAKKFSSCSSAASGGELGPFISGKFVETFEDAIESLTENKISKPVRTQFGYHLIIKYRK